MCLEGAVDMIIIRSRIRLSDPCDGPESGSLRSRRRCAGCHGFSQADSTNESIWETWESKPRHSHHLALCTLSHSLSKPTKRINTGTLKAAVSVIICQNKISMSGKLLLTVINARAKE